MFVISVRHTGTRFLSKALGCNCDHVDRWKIVDDLLVSPLRDPKKVWLSWVVRNTKTRLVCRGPATVKDCFIDSWQRLSKLGSILYVPIDRPEREEQIRLLERKIDNGLPFFYPVRDISVDWDKRPGHVNPQEDPLGDDFWGKAVVWDEWYDELDFIYDLPMISKYYRR